MVEKSHPEHKQYQQRSAQNTSEARRGRQAKKGNATRERERERDVPPGEHCAMPIAEVIAGDAAQMKNENKQNETRQGGEVSVIFVTCTCRTQNGRQQESMCVAVCSGGGGKRALHQAKRG